MRLLLGFVLFLITPNISAQENNEIILKLNDGTTIELSPEQKKALDKIKNKKSKSRARAAPPRPKRRTTPRKRTKTREETNYEQNLSRFYEQQIEEDKRKKAAAKRRKQKSQKSTATKTIVKIPKNELLFFAGINTAGIEVQETGLSNGGTEVQIRKRQVIVIGAGYVRNLNNNLGVGFTMLSNESFLLTGKYQWGG